MKKLGPFAETAKRMNNFIKRVKGSSEEKLKAANELFDFASQTDSATVKQTVEVISAGTNMDRGSRFRPGEVVSADSSAFHISPSHPNSLNKNFGNPNITLK